MRQKKYDLHCHSTFSDGSYNPEKLINLAKEKGFTGLSITDHDTIAAYEEAQFFAQKSDIHLISGVEFSCDFEGKNIHVLGYGFDLDNKDILNLTNIHAQRRHKRHSKILDALKMRGIDLPSNTIDTEGSIGRMHIAKSLLDHGYVKTIGQAFDLYIGDGKCCHITLETPDIKETISIIQKANGKAILAHPHLIYHQKLLYSLLSLPFDGLEAYYGGCNDDRNARYVQLGQKRGWILTGGSDFHGDYKDYRPFGASYVTEECIEQLTS